MQSLNSSLIAVSWTAVADTILNLILNQKKEERENANDSNTALEWQMHWRIQQLWKSLKEISWAMHISKDDKCQG